MRLRQIVFKTGWIWLTAALVAGLTAVAAGPVWAGDLTVSGGKIENSAELERDYSYPMLIQNSSGAPMDIAVEIKGYGTEAENPFVVLEPGDDTSHHSARPYLSVAPAALHLASGESREIVVSANIPEGTEAGGKYAIVYIHTVPKSGSIATTAGMAARVLLTGEGSTLDHTSQISAVDLNAGANLEALVSITNAGNQHYRPSLRATLKKDSLIIASASADDLWPLIPHYSRQFSLVFSPQQTLPVGEYTVEVEVSDESGQPVAARTASLKLDAPLDIATGVKNIPFVPVTITLKPSSEAVLASEDGSISIALPQGAVIGEVPLTLSGYLQGNAPPAPEQYQLGDTCFNVQGLNGLLAKEARLTVKYSAGDLQSAEGDASRLVLARWDASQSGWTMLKTNVDPKNFTLTASTDRFSTWSVMARPAGSSNNLWYLIGGGLAVVALCAIWLSTKRLRKLKT